MDEGRSLAESPPKTRAVMKPARRTRVDAARKTDRDNLDAGFEPEQASGSDT